MNFRTTTSVLLIVLTSGFCQAEIKTKVIEYKAGDTVLEGYLAYDDAVVPDQKRPGVIVVHEWTTKEGHKPFFPLCGYFPKRLMTQSRSARRLLEMALN